MMEAVSAGGAPPRLADRIAAVRSGLAEAARDAGRDAREITVIAVTKFHPAGLIRELAALGVTDIGESRHQEAQAKAKELTGLGLTWHFVGQLQSNKARQVRGYSAVIHSVDRASLLGPLSDPEHDVDCFIQVNLTEDPRRGGIPSTELEGFAEQVLRTPGLRLLGVMAVAPQDAEPRRAFGRLREASDRLRALAPAATSISAGMSGDYREAILEGATHLRIGTAITGNRPAAG